MMPDSYSMHHSFLSQRGWIVACDDEVVIGVTVLSEIERYMLPLPRSNQSGLSLGKRCSIFSMKSKLGLFRPPRMCEMLDGCTPIISAKREGVKPSVFMNFSSRSLMFLVFYKVNIFMQINSKVAYKRKQIKCDNVWLQM